MGKSSNRASLILAIVCAATLTAPNSAPAQTFSVLHAFGYDGAFYPTGGVSVDRNGNLYGTTEYGGSQNCFLGCGIVFRLSRHGSGWLLSPLYSFVGSQDGANPVARVVIGPDGSLFGTTSQGGGTGCLGDLGCGTVFNLRPPQHAPANVLSSWSETVLYRFVGGDDGGGPQSADLIFDPAGNIYGTTLSGGGTGCDEACGTVYQLAPSNGGWTESVIHSFNQPGDGTQPYAGIVRAPSGDLFGATAGGGTYRDGVVFQLVRSASGWTEQVLHNLQQATDGAYSYGGMVLDPAGNLFGTAEYGGPQGGGTVFEMTHSGTWTFTLLTSFSSSYPTGPLGSMVMDPAGNLYGTTNEEGAYNFGTVFKLSPGAGGWTLTTLHDFTNGSDGAFPTGPLAIDAQGNLYGTTTSGGTGGGVVYEITP